MVRRVASDSFATRKSRKAQHSASAAAAASTRRRMSGRGAKRSSARPRASVTERSPSPPSARSPATRDARSPALSVQAIGSGWPIPRGYAALLDACLLAGRGVLAGANLIRRQEVVLDDGVLDVVLRDRDRGQQHRRDLLLAVVDLDLREAVR